MPETYECDIILIQRQSNVTCYARCSSWQKGHEPKLLRTLASELGVEISEIVDFELHLYDTLGASFNGLDGEFITSSRLDNQMGCYVSLQALLNHADKSLKDDSDVSLIALFDHEEVGSSSTTGAGSTLIEESVKRISGAMREEEDGQDLLECQIRKSFVVSFDMAHAEHPNYSTKVRTRIARREIENDYYIIILTQSPFALLTARKIPRPKTKLRCSNKNKRQPTLRHLRSNRLHLP